jgi:hypothetical protein
MTQLNYTSLSNSRKFDWCPLYLNTTAKHGISAFLLLPNDWTLYFRFAKDDEDVAVWSALGFCLTRPETDEEKTDREDAFLEEAWLEIERDRYTQWSY